MPARDIKSESAESAQCFESLLDRLVAEVAFECVKRQQQKKSFLGRARLVLFVLSACLAPVVAIEPSAVSSAAHSSLLHKAHLWASDRIHELPPPARDALAGASMFAAVMLPPMPMPLAARTAFGVAAAGFVVHRLHSSGGSNKRSVEEELFTQSNPPPIRPAQAMSKIEERMEAGSLVLHSAELIRSWAVDWATELTTRSVRSMPALMLLGDVAGTAAVTGALRSYLIEGETSWVGSHPGVLELDTRRCPAADCTEQIEAFMVARSRAKRPGLIILSNVDGFGPCPEATSARRRCAANSERWADMMGALEKFVEPSIGARIEVAATGCPPLGCRIRPNQFALVLTAAALDAPSCREMYADAAGDSSWLVRELRKVRSRMWDPASMDSDRAATVPAIANRIGRVLGLACA